VLDDGQGCLLKQSAKLKSLASAGKTGLIVTELP
jgi:hypothetical protein